MMHNTPLPFVSAFDWLVDSFALALSSSLTVMLAAPQLGLLSHGFCSNQHSNVAVVLQGRLSSH